MVYAGRIQTLDEADWESSIAGLVQPSYPRKKHAAAVLMHIKGSQITCYLGADLLGSMSRHTVLVCQNRTWCQKLSHHLLSTACN